MTTTWRSKIPTVAKRSHKDLSALVRTAALKIEQQAKIAAPVDTGFLRNSIYTVTNRESGRPAADAAAQSIRKGASLGPEPTADDDLTAIVAVGAEYGIYVELGTVRAPAQPYLLPAARKVLGDLGSDLKEVIG